MSRVKVRRGCAAAVEDPVTTATAVIHETTKPRNHEKERATVFVPSCFRVFVPFVVGRIPALAYRSLASIHRHLRCGARGAPRAPLADARVAVFLRPDGRLALLRPLGATPRRPPMDRSRRLLSGAAVSVLSWRRLRDRRTSCVRRPRFAGGAGIAVVRSARARRRTVLLIARF